jgi:Lipase (class 3)
LEHCFFINHDQTGGSCAVYRSLEQRLIIVSFRGTCQPIDLVTDASIFQEPWVEGEYGDEELPGLPLVHVGFRKSLNSISRRLKELILATVSPGEDLRDYDVLVTGHS